MKENNDLMRLYKPKTLPDVTKKTDSRAFDLALLKLLSARTERYTMGESSSVTVEMAEKLLQSIRYTLAVACEAQGLCLTALPEQTDLPQLLKTGQAEIEQRIRAGKALLHRAGTVLADIDDVTLHDTLTEIGLFFKRYNLWFFAHDIPCSIDYILDAPISEELQGIDYINAYLTTLIAEGRLVPLQRQREEQRLNALLSQQNNMQHTDGEAVKDNALRALIESLNSCCTGTEKADLVKVQVHSLRDMVEVLDVCFWDDESIAIFDLLNMAELALLYHFAKNRPTENCSPTQWEQRLKTYISEKIKS